MQQAMEEKYKLCDDILRQLLEWIRELEVQLANQEPANEHLDGIRNQINLLKVSQFIESVLFWADEHLSMLWRTTIFLNFFGPVTIVLVFCIQLIKEELDSKTRHVSNCQDDVRTIVTTGAEFLERDEVSSIEKAAKTLKTKYERAQTTTDKLLRRLGSAADELHKFR